MTDITTIPLNKLSVWTGNVRKTHNKSGIEELAASIKAHGLQHNLVVRKDGKKFAVVAGGRRLKALQLLAKAGDIEAGFGVPCRITEGDNDTELSLAENVMREDMHPADQFEAFRKLVDEGMPVTDIAARFGCSEAHVTKLLKLARVSSKVIKAYRNGELTLECVMAFTVTEDHEAQEKVLAEFNPDRHEARDIRDSLTENDIPATDKRVKFVTLKAYEKAGGKVKRDLFSEDDSGVYIEDAALLDSLVYEKLARPAKTLKDEGWKWVQVLIDFGYEQSSQYKRIYAEPVPLTADEQAKLDSLQAEYAALDDNGEESDESSERMSELDRQISEIEDRDGVWTPEQLGIAGAVVFLGHDGKVRIEHGFVKPEDMPKPASKGQTAKAAAGSSGDAEEPQGAGLSAALVESLTAHRSAAIAASLLEQPDKALATVVYALVMDVFGHGYGTVLELTGRVQSLKAVEGSTAFQKLEQARENWGQRIPGTPDAIWQWCLEQDQAVLLDLLAFCSACMVNTVQHKHDRPDCDRLVHANALGKAVSLDMKAWYTPASDNYFGRVSRTLILEALVEARKQPVAPAWEKLKKAELSALAMREIAGTGWLPVILR
jgi:ParB family chromosome partitioning protein